MKKIYPILLSGGSGTRLWPSSRKMFPKQFLPFDNNDSLFIKTLKRKAKKKLGWQPKTSFKDLVKEMLEHELRLLK